MITSLASAEIEWTWSATDPASWSIDTSSDGGVTWTQFDVSPGSDRSYGGFSGGELASIVGLDGLGSPVTERSNSVIVML